MSTRATIGDVLFAVGRGGSRRAQRFGQAVVLLTVLLGGQVVRGGVIQETLYDGTLQETTPDLYTPTWLAFGGLATNQAYDNANDATRLNTTSFASIMGGYANYSPAGQLVHAGFPALNRQLGYKIAFALRMLSETHSSPARAGFSIIAVSSDAASGVASSIEIGFQSGRVFSQSDDFGPTVADENTSFDPVGSEFINYALAVHGSNYELTAGSNVILTGALHNHFDHNINWPVSPYQISNFLFLGDDTTSASAEILLRSVRVEVTTVPEPASWLLFGLGTLGLFVWRRCRAARSR